MCAQRKTGPEQRAKAQQKTGGETIVPETSSAQVGGEGSGEDASQSRTRRRVPEFREVRFEPSFRELPESVLPDKRHITIYDQGAEGAAVGFALAAVINYLRSELGITTRVSPVMLYLLARRYDEWPGEDYSGTSARGAIKALMAHGVCGEDQWPFGADQWNLGAEDIDRKLAEVEEAALENRPRAVERVATNRLKRERLAAAVEETHAVLVTAEVHEGWDRVSNGLISLTAESKVHGDHAFAVIGYTHEGFIIQNSWGTAWGGVEIDGITYEGCAVWTYEDFEQSVTDAWVVRYRDVRRGRTPAPVVGGLRSPGFDADDVKAEDSLGITPDVRAMAAVLANREVKPPLSLGLFGDWGSGKSFFMKELKRYIESLEEHSKKDDSTPNCSSVVQIRFNAWHYLDANLWASLAAEIFKRLFEKISDESTSDVNLKQELAVAQGLYQQAELEHDIAVELRNKAESDLSNNKQELKEKQAEVIGVALLQQLRKLAAELGIPEEEVIHKAVEEEKNKLETTAIRLRHIFQLPPGYGGKSALAVAAVVLVGIGFAVQKLSPDMATWIESAKQWVNQYTTLGIGLASWIAKRAAQGHKLVGEVDQALTEARKKVEAAPRKEKEELKKAENKVSAARKKLEEAHARIEALEEKISEQAPGKQMSKFIQERGTSTDYKQKLGLVTLIRNDFERLSKLLEESEREFEESRKANLDTSNEEPPGPGETSEQAETTGNGDVPIMPVQRIILYIDDLDRCKPDRVVEVLEAVHLLLFFRLFVVVVAVDPRWLRRCLEEHYSNLLSMYERDDLGVPSDGLLQRSTPQDYLEKIFHIPFYLRPISETGYQDLIRDLTSRDIERGAHDQGSPGGNQRHSRGRGTPPPRGAEPFPRSTTPPAATGGGDGSGGEGAAGGNASGQEQGTIADKLVKPQQVRFRSWEQEDMMRLAPLFHTPRSIKRFVNTYRLVRAGVPELEIPAFEGTREDRGEYRVAMTLLAVVCGYPNVAPTFLKRFIEKSEDSRLMWSDFLSACKNDDDDVQTWADPGYSDEPDTEALRKRVRTYKTEWSRLCEALERISANNLLPEQLDLFLKWLPVVARYSFSVNLAPQAMDGDASPAAEPGQPAAEE